MFIRVVLPFAVVLLIAAATPAQDTKKELEKLQGEWTMVSMETRGKKAPDDVVNQDKLTIKGDQWTVTTLKGGEGKATFKIDPSKTPKTIDLTFEIDKTAPSRGIYKLEGDTLILCRTAGHLERPKEFKTTEEAGILMVWKRTKN